MPFSAPLTGWKGAEDLRKLTHHKAKEAMEIGEHPARYLMYSTARNARCYCGFALEDFIPAATCCPSAQVGALPVPQAVDLALESCNADALEPHD